MARPQSLQAVIAGFYPPPFGGESVHVWKLSARLRSAGILKQVVNLRRGAPPSTEYVNGAGPARLWWALMRLLSAGTLLHLHTNGHGWKSWVMIFCAACALRLRHAPGVLTLHSGMAPRFFARANTVESIIVRLGLGGFSQIVCVNDEIRQALIHLGVSEDRLSVAPAFLGAAPAALGNEDERLLRNFRPLLSVVAGSGPEYGLPILIETLQRLQADFPEIGCVILGTDGDGGPAEMVQTLGLSGRVRFLGPLPYERCLAFITRSDVFVRPSLTDGDAVSVREALAMRVPVVASDTASRPPGVMLFRVGESNDLVEKLAELLRTDPKFRTTVPGKDFGDAILSVYQKAMDEFRTQKRGVAQSAQWAWRSLRREILGFRVDYPIEIVPGAERPDSLRCYIYSDQLFLDDLDPDHQGVPLKHYRLLGSQYNPLFVAWWGLHHLERAARERDDRHLKAFLTQLDWLKANAVARDDGAVVWPCHFDWREGAARLQAPWISAMYQGVVMSALVRGFRLTRDEKLLELALAGSRVFSLDVTAGGVRTFEAGRTLYEEYPAYPLPRILDGFLFALLGLYDLSVQTGRDDIRQLFTEGIEGLASHLGWWNYHGKWSWYGSHGYLCPPHYHALNRALLTVLYRLTGRQALQDMAEAWAPHTLSWGDRVGIFLVFAFTKNWARVRFMRRAR